MWTRCQFQQESQGFRLFSAIVKAGRRFVASKAPTLAKSDRKGSKMDDFFYTRLERVAPSRTSQEHDKIDSLLRAYSSQLVRAQTTLLDEDWIEAKCRFSEFQTALIEIDGEYKTPAVPVTWGRDP
jgi:hypothetical protein